MTRPRSRAPSPRLPFADWLPAHDPVLPAAEAYLHGAGRCACHPGGLSRRGFTALLAAGSAAPALAREGVQVKDDSWAMRQAKKLITADMVEQAGTQQYRQMLGQAQQQGALVPREHPQAQRLQYIGERILPFVAAWNPRAKQWKWEVNLIASKQINAFCMPGGKIAFYTGILSSLKLSDAEVAAIMGHEVAHALQEHARERIAQSQATRLGANIAASLLGLGDLGNLMAGAAAQLATLKFSRDDESEADLIGLELSARAGYAPQAGISLWQKMAQASKGAPPQFLSTHPSGETRIRDMERNLAAVAPLFERAAKPERAFPVAPPA